MVGEKVCGRRPRCRRPLVPVDFRTEALWRRRGGGREVEELWGRRRRSAWVAPRMRAERGETKSFRVILVKVSNFDNDYIGTSKFMKTA